MDLSERIQLIIKENCLKQKQFAIEIGVTESYISAILSKRNKNISHSLARLIEQKFDYNANWILTGEEPKFKQVSSTQTLSDAHKKAIIQMEKMSEDQAIAVLAFINSLEKISENLNKKPSENNPSASAASDQQEDMLQ